MSNLFKKPINSGINRYKLVNQFKIMRTQYKQKNLEIEIINLILENKKNKNEKLITERKLSELLSSKRSDIRDALLIIENKGMIKRKPGSGTFINYNIDEKDNEKTNFKIDKKYLSETFFSSIEVRSSIEPIISAYVADNLKKEESNKLESGLNKIRNAKKWIDIKLNTYNYFTYLYSLSKNKYYINIFNELVKDRKLSNFDGHYISERFTSDNNVSKVIALTSYINIKKTFDPIKDGNRDRAFKESKNYLNKILSYIHI